MPRHPEIPIGRFAPSPTGDLHFGSLVAALASWLSVKHAGGRWLLRVEDIDPPREVAGSAASILAALDAFGFSADAPVLYQSRRGDAYAAVLQRLREAGHAFPCWCSRTDLEAAGALHRDGHCVSPAVAERQPAWRLRVRDLDIEFEDLLQGPQHQNVRDAVGDFVLRRADGLWSYQLACVVDDAFQGITEVVRGCDLLESTPRQILLQQLLGLPTPAYAHIPLALNANGCKLSKASAAPVVDMRSPIANLARALRFLRQPVPDAPAAADMLQHAARHYDPLPLRGLPNARSTPGS
ncbi:MAG TPA: tRNA glutamyl-Q(34) synthetase GluQRS [Rhodanobacteraceae bacterium]|nr:tRNA glutamyl-Q(34) synthetase GluQRS [Rhodanobacteraceae bacterium]